MIVKNNTSSLLGFLMLSIVVSLVLSLAGCQDDQKLKPFYWDAALTDEYVPPTEDPTGGQDPALIADGAQVFQNKYGSILIPASWTIGKDRSGVDVKNLANGAVFRSSADDSAEIVTIKIYNNLVTEPSGFATWFESFYSRLPSYQLSQDYSFNGLVYKCVTFDAMIGGTAYKLEYMSPNNTLVEVNIYNSSPDDPDIRFILDSVHIKG
jgi:hypothetical protein